MRRTGRRSDCPINFALETFGDTWSLLIVRDIVFWGKRTYGDFLNSKEGIATNILAARLDFLEHQGILHKTPHPTDKRKDVYALTEKGLDLIPMLLEIVAWGAKHDPRTDALKKREFVAEIHNHRKKTIEIIKRTVRNGGSVFSK
jgi:DNA-binding HxlR family transcriptional regulator